MTNPPVQFTDLEALTNELRQIRPPVYIPNYWLWAAGILGGLLLLGLIFWLGRRWWRHLHQPIPLPIVPPQDLARKKLEEALAFFHDPRLFCFTVSDAIRTYMENRFHLRAPEQTTEEFLEDLTHSPLLNTDQKRALGDFLQQCDLAKFARVEPPQPQLQILHKSAHRLIDETEERPGSSSKENGEMAA